MHPSYPLQIAVILASIGCVGGCKAQARPEVPAAYRLQIEDSVAARELTVSIVSDDSRPLCVGRYIWPGSVSSGSPMFLVAGERSFFRPGAAVLNVHCPRGCGHERIRPHGRLVARVAYGEFGDAAQIAAAPLRTLKFAPQVSVCAN